MEIDFAVDPEIEFTRDTRWQNRAVTIDEMQTGPH